MKENINLSLKISFAKETFEINKLLKEEKHNNKLGRINLSSITKGHTDVRAFQEKSPSARMKYAIENKLYPTNE